MIYIRSIIGDYQTQVEDDRDIEYIMSLVK